MLWRYDRGGRLLSQEGAQPGNEQWRGDSAVNPLDHPASEKVVHNRLTQLNGIHWQYDVHGRTIEKDNAQVRWRYRSDGEHRLSEVLTGPRDRNKPRLRVSLRYDPPVPGSVDVYDWPGHFVDHGHGESYARIRQEVWQAGHHSVSGSGTATGIAPGFTFSIINGDPDHPLIIGRVYNEATMPPWVLPAAATQMGF
ncbi:contractile injection system protein, VgrG/Pvc8 family [Pseudomonas cerasi]